LSEENQKEMKTAKEQADSVRQNDIFDKTFLLNQLKDAAVADKFLKNAMSQARKNALMLGGALIIALISVVYAFVQETLAKEAQRKTEILTKQYAQCKDELEKQKGLAQESALITEEVTRMAEEQLKLCQAAR
jgi:hypothetical protein